MKIAITGSSGSVGKAIVEMALAQGHHVVSIDRVAPDKSTDHPALEFVQAELTDYSAFESAIRGCDALIHMAAIPALSGVQCQCHRSGIQPLASFRLLSIG